MARRCSVVRITGTPEYRNHPYLAEDTALWLVEKGVRMIGVGTTKPDLGGADDCRQSVRSRGSSTRSWVGL
jgi:kynurenine formamidase